MQREALEVEPRQGLGKGPARRLRAEGKVPGVVYGTGLEPVNVQLPRLALEKVLLHGSNALLDLSGVALAGIQELEERLNRLEEMERRAA